MSGNTRGNTRGKVRLVLDLYRAGLSPKEIAVKVYGSDSRRARQRVHNIIYLYGRRLGLLKEVRPREDAVRGEVVDASSGLVLRSKGLGEVFVEHSRPVTNSDPYLGSYRNMRQLKASLKRGDVRAVNAMGFVDRFLGPLNVPHESVVREDAMLLARKFSSSGKPKEVGAAASFASVLLHRPGDAALLAEVLLVNGVKSVSIPLLADMLSAIYNG